MDNWMCNFELEIEGEGERQAESGRCLSQLLCLLTSQESNCESNSTDSILSVLIEPG